MARDGLTDKRWKYIYIRSILGPSKNSKRSIISLASGSTGLFYFLANDPVSGRVQNLETVTESKPPIFVLWWRGNSITCSSIFQRDKPWMIGNPFHEIFSKERIYRSIERGAINKEFWEARKIVDREFWKRESRVFPSFIATHSWLSTPRCNNVAAQRDSLFTHHHKSEPREWAAGGGFGLRFEFDNRMVLPFLQKKKNSLQITLQFRTKISPTNAEKYLVLPSIVIVTKR